KVGYFYEWDYYITTQPIEIGPSVDAILPNGNRVILSHKHYDKHDAPPVIGSFEVYGPTSNGTKTISEAAMELYNSSGKDVPYIVHQASDSLYNNDECVGYFYTSQPAKSDWSYAHVPGGCLVVPPAQDWCKITTPQLEFDHGTIALKNT
ncbi:hypothetical protein INF70_21925, partial [Enterobacter cloacae complex sp. P4RS]|nr:hypothetical protein [Enterobacter cloacae complex sp. P4RS]